ncbi:GAF and ANTAR domain-containing protein [Nocardioides currus]|uniref:GAF and ANTAR domain-containing protein n=1 Tax=Nocardioides currus TaxID=2133958 RepID=UPI001401CF6A|nr:GAF and ANTAR domain-containing protein [Nocardioides currus]
MIDVKALESLSSASLAISQHRTHADVLQEVVDQAALCLPEFEHVSISLILPDRQLDTLAATTDLARELDRAQSEARGGPCVEAGRLDEVMLVDDARHEQRWPRYIEAALALGLRSQLGIKLSSDTRGAICLNLHSTTHDDLDAGSVGVAEHFAVHAALALGHARASDQLKTAVGTRTIIGTAIGIVMERYGLGQDQAFKYLVRLGSDQNRKLRVVAQELVQAKDDAARPSGSGDGTRSGATAARP